jgi:hypothetical protein
MVMANSSYAKYAYRKPNGKMVKGTAAFEHHISEVGGLDSFLSEVKAEGIREYRLEETKRTKSWFNSKTFSSLFKKAR